MSKGLGVLLMAYGSPATLDDVEAYYTHIRGGRTPSPEQVEALRQRYLRIGGRSPLLEITQRQAQRVQGGLARIGLPVGVYVGMKHASPFIANTVAEMARDGLRTAVGLALTPQYARMSVGTYLDAAADAAASRGLTFLGIESWYDHPGFIQALAARVGEARRAFAQPEAVPVIFTAHSLPQRILEWQDPYPSQLQETCLRVAAIAGVHRWHFAYQSAGHTGEPWLGPDLLEVLQEMDRAGDRAVIVCPVGFVADHLEVLFDVDVEARELAATLGMRLERAPSLNDSEDFVAALADVIRTHVARFLDSRVERGDGGAMGGRKGIADGEAVPTLGRRAPRPPLTRATFYRTAVPVLLAVLVVVTVIVLLLAGGVLLGVIPYPGR